MPVQGKVYRLTGGKNDKAISNGNTFAESEVRNPHLALCRLGNYKPCTSCPDGHDFNPGGYCNKCNCGGDFS